MNIILSPHRPLTDVEIVAVKDGDAISINYELFDFSNVGEGDTLPGSSAHGGWFLGDISRLNGELTLTLLMPIPINYSQAQAFPAPLLGVKDGVIQFPAPNMEAGEIYVPLRPDPQISITDGVIDWSQLITKAMKDAAVAAAQLASAKAELSSKNSAALTQIARIQDRIDTIGFGIDIGEATQEDESEQASLMLTLKAWKTYKYALGKVTVQPTWYQAPVWPIEPPIPEIIAAPMLAAAESI